MSDLSSFLSTKQSAWTAELWDGFIQAVIARFGPLEEQNDVQKEVTNAIISRGLSVIEAELAPIVAQASEILDGSMAEVTAKLTRFETKVAGGTVLAASKTSASLSFGGTIDITIDADDREFFAPTPYVALSRATTVTNWAIAKVLSFNRQTGAMALLLEQVNNAGGPFADWVVTSLPAATLLQKTLYDQALTIKDTLLLQHSQAVADMANLVAQAQAKVSLASGYANDALTNANTTVDKAAAASASATAAANSASASSTSALASASSKDKSAEWASAPKGQPVVDGGVTGRSARHYAETAALIVDRRLSLDAQVLTLSEIGRVFANVNAASLSGNRNKVDNGDFNIWQKGLSQSVAGRGSVDRWSLESVGSATSNMSRQTHPFGQTDVPGLPRYFTRINVLNSGDAATGIVDLWQNIEGADTLSGGKSTLVFYARSDANRQIAADLSQIFGTGGSPSARVSGIGATKWGIGTGWTRCAALVDVPSVAGKILGSGNNDCLSIAIFLSAGTSFNSRTNSLGPQTGTFDISHVCLVPGDATNEYDPFPARSQSDELIRCQRFLEIMPTMSYLVAGTAAGNVGVNPSFKVKKCFVPAVTMTNVTYTLNSSGLTTSTINLDGFRADWNSAGSNGTNHSVIAFGWTADGEVW